LFLQCASLGNFLLEVSQLRHVLLWCAVQDGEPLGIVDEVIRSRKRRRKASDEQIDADVHMLVQQVTLTGTGGAGWVAE
jgi:hypothetical protein